MKRVLAAAAVAAVLVGATAAPVSAANEITVAKCDAVILKQFAKDLSAGGGPKAGILAPTNCDHFFQVEGLIGGGK